MPPKKKKQRVTEEDAKALLVKLGHFVVSSKDRFYSDLSNNLENAWATRGSERYLYTVFSHIISHLCNTIVPAQFPTSTISHTPQAVFGVTQPPPGQAAKPVAKADLHPDRIPDFARMIFTFKDYQEGHKFIRKLIDIWEIKGLNIAQRWDSDTARSKALDAIELHVEQLWKQTRAAFAHNESWTHVYALLIIGPYFSQFVWKRPAGVIKLPTVDITKSETRDTVRLYNNYNALIDEVKARDVPHIEFFNAPVFDFTPAGDGLAQEVSLSEHFLYALSLPLKEHFGDCEIQPSWFDPPSEKPNLPLIHEMDPDIDPANIIRAALISNRLSEMEGRRDAQFGLLSSTSDSPEDEKDRFDPTPRTKTALKGWQARPPPSPLAVNRRRRPGVAPANQPLLLPVPPAPQPVDQPVDDLETRDDGDDEDDNEMMDEVRRLGLEDDEEDYADDEETEGQNDYEDGEEMESDEE